MHVAVCPGQVLWGPLLLIRGRRRLKPPLETAMASALAQ